MVDLKNFIVRTRLNNTNEIQINGGSAFDTQDYVFLESLDERTRTLCIKIKLQHQKPEHLCGQKFSTN